MPNYPPPKPRDRNNGQDDNYYDLDQHICVVLYDERQDGYICGYCCDDFTHSQLHATYGGDILPMRIRPLKQDTQTLARRRMSVVWNERRSLI